MRATSMRRVLAMAAVFAAGVVIAGCGSSSDSGSTDGSDVNAQIATAEGWDTTTPEATGELDSVTWGLPYGEPSTLDYVQAASYSENTVLSSVCEGLLRTAPDLSVEPSLAEKVEHPDSTTYVYELRNGVEFSDGSPMTADDVVFSLERNLDPSSGSFWTSWYENVDDITAKGDSTVEVTLKQPDVMFNQFMGTAAGTVVEKDYFEKNADDFGSSKGGVMCTGPFVLSDWTPGESITVERNDNYWDTENPAQTKEIKFEFVTDSSALSAALESGEIDGAYDAPSSLESSDAGTLYNGRSTQFVAESFSTRPGPVQDVRIREALSLVLDRAAIAEKIFNESAIGFFSYYTPATWGYARDTFREQVEQLPAPNTIDLEKAKSLVDDYAADEGQPRELELELNADDPAQRQLGTYIESQAEQAGLEVKVVALPANQSIAVAFDPELKKEYDIISGTGYIDVADPMVWAIWGLTPGGIFNDNEYENPKVTKLTEQARQTEDEEKRADLLGQIQDIAYGQDHASIFIANLSERLYLGKRVTGVPASMPGYIYYPWSRDLGAAGG